jgi:hypothetical protein
MRDNDQQMSDADDPSDSSPPSDPTSGPRPDAAPAASGPPGQARRRVPVRVIVAVLAGVIPLVPIVIALSLSGGSSNGGTATARSLYTPVASAPTGHKPPARDKGSLVALVTHPTAMRSAPGGHAFARVTRRTEFGSPEALWVVRRSGRWLGVVSPLAGNGRLGWIAAGTATLNHVDWKLKVSLRTHRLSVFLNGRVMQRYRVAIGAPASPTPSGRFAVTDRLSTGDPSGPYGCCILALSAKAPHAIQGWSGGDRIAIHSTPETWTIGKAISHGCVRLTLAEGRWLLAHIPLGTPTLIST